MTTTTFLQPRPTPLGLFVFLSAGLHLFVGSASFSTNPLPPLPPPSLATPPPTVLLVELATIDEKTQLPPRTDDSEGPIARLVTAQEMQRALTPPPDAEASQDRKIDLPSRDLAPTEAVQLMGLLDKSPNRDKPQASGGDGPKDKLTLSELDVFRMQLRPCWTVPIGARRGKELVVQVKVQLTAEGFLRRAPEVLSKNPTADPFLRAAVEHAVRAIRRCQPFRLPEDKHTTWRELILVFNPEKMGEW